MAVDEYEFKLDDTGVLLNSGDTIPFVDITRATGLDSPEFRESMRDHEGVDGGFIDAEFERGREIILEGTIYGDPDNFETYMDTIKANFAPSSVPIPFYLKSPGVDERVIFVKPRGVRYDWDTMRRIGMTTAQFMMYAEDPRQYTNLLISQSISYGGDTGVGLQFSFGFDVDFGGGATPGGGNVTNNGNRSTPCIIVITGPVTNPVITNATVGSTIRFSIALTALDTLTIDTGNRTVYLNGSINRRNTMTTSEWFYIVPGTNQINYGALSGTGSSLNIQFRSAWR